MLHLIPDDGAPHAPTTECGCDPQPQLIQTDGGYRTAMVHPAVDPASLREGGAGGVADGRSGPGEG